MLLPLLTNGKSNQSYEYPYFIVCTSCPPHSSPSSVSLPISISICTIMTSCPRVLVDDVVKKQMIMMIMETSHGYPTIFTSNMCYLSFATRTAFDVSFVSKHSLTSCISILFHFSECVCAAIQQFKIRRRMGSGMSVDGGNE